MNNQYTLYGARFSLYSGKLRSYLEKKGVPFEEVPATLSVYKKFIIPRTGVRYIPVLQTPEDEVLQDTTEIIDELEKRFPNTSCYPSSPKQRLVALLLETYGDEWLLIPAMHYRWNFQEANQPYIYQQFGKLVSPKLPKLVRGWLGKKLGARFKDVVPKLGITEETKPAIEASFMALLGELNAHFEAHDYLLGARSSIADYGFIGPFYAHLYLDPYPGDLLRREAPNVVAWVERMTNGERAEGDFVAHEEIPTTLLPILKRMADEQLPVLRDTDAKLSAWRSKNPDQAIPRFIGEHEFQIGGVTGTRIIIPYSLWMYRRAVDYFQSIDEADRLAISDLLAPTGVANVISKGLSNQLIRFKNEIQFE